MKSEQFISHPNVLSGKCPKMHNFKYSIYVESWDYPVKISELIDFFLL